jgi:excisionase family DNA binding protein
MTTEIASSHQSALLSVVAVAELLACSPRHVYRLADAGQMPQSVKLGTLVRWQRDVLLDWIAGGCQPVAPPVKTKQQSPDSLRPNMKDQDYAV